MDNIVLQKKIMRKVCWTCYLRRVINPFMIKIYALLAVIVGVASTVSITNVIANMPSISNFTGLYSFYMYAFNNTEILVKAFVVGIALFTILLIVDVIKRVPKLSFS